MFGLVDTVISKWCSPMRGLSTLDRVVDDEVSAVLADSVVHPRGVGGDSHFAADRRLIQTDMALVLGEQHVRGKRTRADEGQPFCRPV